MLRILRGGPLLDLGASTDCAQAYSFAGRATVLFNGLEEACKSIDVSDHFFELLNYVVAFFVRKGEVSPFRPLIFSRC